ncbi:LysM repeat protein [Allocatelliglobosispora scoriae]|uniref:LysM repeat protein n=1 Tax=Allocatelliglobosispora scoriae TaxID=643052 RepID=A0A841BPG6_9ACTN|nr:LysM peptidoglycan-binding domain-containing protein [Allocatelliglobosispora scoriae]MBB5869079.1 LysM repeat protein [Allocatelliglobosispora scoriae]
MAEAFEVLIEVAKFAPVKLKVTDTCPTCPGGWRDRPGWDFHVDKKAVDFALAQNAAGQKAMRDFARWMHQYSGYLLELIHTTPFSDDNGFYVKNGKKVSESFYGPATSAAHMNHVHVAANLDDAQRLLVKLQASGAKAATGKESASKAKKATTSVKKATAKKPKAGLASSYTIQPGDTLSAVAGRFGVTVDGILKLNPKITDPDLINAGDVLKMM